jgi:hypothetical protein
MALYNASAVGVKAVHSSLHVGGPATEHLNTENFMSQARKWELQLILCPRTITRLVLEAMALAAYKGSTGSPVRILSYKTQHPFEAQSH